MDRPRFKDIWTDPDSKISITPNKETQIYLKLPNAQNPVTQLYGYVLQSNPCQIRTETKDDGFTYNIAESNNIEESGISPRGTAGGGILVHVFVSEQSRRLAHRIGELRQFLDRFHR